MSILIADPNGLKQGHVQGQFFISNIHIIFVKYNPWIFDVLFEG